MRLSKISILIILFFTSCATIIHGSSQKINFVSSPSGASVSVNNVNKGATPLLLKLKRNDNHLVQMSLPSYQSFQTTLSQKFDALVIGNVFFGGIIGAVVDVANGAAYKLEPNKQVPLQNATYGKDETKKGTKVLSVVLVPDVPTSATLSTPASENKISPVTPVHIVEIETDNAYTAIINKPIKFRPDRKDATKDITVELDKKFVWDELTLVGVNGIAISEPVKAKYKTHKKSQEFVFDGWSVVRFLPVGTGQNKFDLNFRATSGGRDFPAVATAALDLN